MISTWRLLTCHDRILLYADNICCLAILKVFNHDWKWWSSDMMFTDWSWVMTITITITITIILIRRVLALTSAAAQWHIRFPMERTWARRRCRILILDTVIETIFGIIIKRTFETSSIYASSLISIIIIRPGSSPYNSPRSLQSTASDHRWTHILIATPLQGAPKSPPFNWSLYI